MKILTQRSKSVPVRTRFGHSQNCMQFWIYSFRIETGSFGISGTRNLVGCFWHETPRFHAILRVVERARLQHLVWMHNQTRIRIFSTATQFYFFGLKNVYLLHYFHQQLIFDLNTGLLLRQLTRYLLISHKMWAWIEIESHYRLR